MKLKADITIPRPKGTWEVKRWNLLRGETEEDVEATVQNNFMTDACAIAGLMRNNTGVFRGNQTVLYPKIGSTAFEFLGYRKALLLEGDLTPEETRMLGQMSTVGVELKANNGGSVYFFPSGVQGADVGKEVKALGAYGNNTGLSNGSPYPAYLLNLPTPIVLEEGDVIKVTFTAELPTAVSSGNINIPSTSYAYGEDPEDPEAGTSGATYTGTLQLANDFFARDSPGSIKTAQVKRNGDGSLEFENPAKLTYKSHTSSVSGSPSNITSTTFAVGVVFNFSTPYPQQLPGSYYEIELDLNIKIAPVS